MVDEIRRRFGDTETTGPVSRGLAMFKNGLKVYFTKPGHIIVPGLAGDLQLKLNGSLSTVP